jgi:hypothetical protein
MALDPSFLFPVHPSQSRALTMAKTKENSVDNPPKWQVSLHGAPSRVVSAGSQAEAIAAYKAACGITDSDHPFIVNPIDVPTVMKVPDLLVNPESAANGQ